MIHEVASYSIMLQLIDPARTKYSRSRYVSPWTNESVQCFKLIVLSFSCLIVFYARPQDLFHWDNSIRARILSCGVATLWLLYEDSGKLRNSVITVVVGELTMYDNDS